MKIYLVLFNYLQAKDTEVSINFYYMSQHVSCSRPAYKIYKWINMRDFTGISNLSDLMLVYNGVGGA